MPSGGTASVLEAFERSARDAALVGHGGAGESPLCHRTARRFALALRGRRCLRPERRIASIPHRRRRRCRRQRVATTSRTRRERRAHIAPPPARARRRAPAVQLDFRHKMISGVPKLRASDGAAGAGLLWARAAREDRPTCGVGWAAACLEHALEQMEAHSLTVALPLPLRRQADRPSPEIRFGRLRDEGAALGSGGGCVDGGSRT